MLLKHPRLLMMQYGVDAIGVRTFIAKIKMCNDASVALFSKLGYTETRCELSLSCRGHNPTAYPCADTHPDTA